MFHSIWWKLPQFDFRYCSALTRILPWGVPGPPLLRNRGCVRTLGGQRYNLSLNKLSPHSKWSVTWSTYLIQYGGRGVYNSITMHAQIFVMYVGPMKWDQSQGNKLIKDFESFDIMFLFIWPSKMLECSKGWPIKLLDCRHSIKSVWLIACTCALMGASSRLFMRHLRFFCGSPARPRPGENTGIGILLN